ncbi:MAG: putative terminase large subunit [Prokaryotic dsDNA virus sp.]|nr:MAG: putative terminase large subunit [Prokaryotic dsDNA virus sp.]
MPNEFYDLVPKDLEANLAFRNEIIRTGSTDRKAAEELYIMCSRDLLFYVNAFCWTYDPRVGDGVLPFVTYEFQDEVLTDIESALGNRDLVIKKSRDMGASWMLLTVFEWRWHFRANQSFLLVSRNEDYVDKPGNPKSLFWKIDFIHKYLPGWLQAKHTRTKLRLTNEDNGSSIDGESTTGDVARGDRRTAIGLDEFAAFDIDAGYRALASTRDATNSRIFNSTPSGTNNAFYDLANNETMEQLSLHWTLHPVKSTGSYEDSQGKTRSPWYDEECKRCANPQEIAQELDIDFAGSDYQFFDTRIIDDLIQKTGSHPYTAGELKYNAITGKPEDFDQKPKGTLRLWCHPDAQGDLPTDRRYVIGADIAAGTGSSNSVLSIGDCKTGEKVGELVTPNLRPDQLATYAVALAQWFKGNSEGALLIWEAPGPGRNFGDRVLELGYRRIWYKKDQSGKISKIPGWWPTKDEKRVLYSEYRSALSTKHFINHSADALRECKEIIFAATGWITHSRSLRTVDPSGARENHGDRPTADALLWKGMQKIPSDKPIPIGVPRDSMIWRRQQVETRKRKAMEW